MGRACKVLVRPARLERGGSYDAHRFRASQPASKGWLASPEVDVGIEAGIEAGMAIKYQK
jgi:hypothetical protein